MSAALKLNDNENEQDLSGIVESLNRVQAIIEFSLDGTIITANDNFLDTLGYSLDEIRGKHHRIFCEKSITESIEYKKFWEKLRLGEFDTGEYKRKTKDGKDVWINASYNPIIGANGKPYKVIKFATDITESKMMNADFEGQLNACLLYTSPSPRD